MQTTKLFIALLLLAGTAVAAPEAAPAASGHLQRDGVNIDFAARPADGGELIEDALVDVSF
ncbi:MAG TPA: hypothetical protein VFH22_04780, partial [Rhodocyclaceae bacterium]|nr:hypothetical protein [Rhodocyclaceae bacterium]